jgi:D-alanyl-D-alanine carboxypeptidase/D-alanyl-D-alanine-endopeptidase (penicillin-binding protein 4)
VLLASPANPTGAVIDRSELARIAALLRERGVQVVGKVLARHRPVEAMDRNADLAPPAAPDPHWLARLEPPPLAANVVETNKQSNNLHAELLLRRMGRIHGDGSLADGLAAEQQVFDAAGIPRAGYDLADGSGMSTYDRASPRAVVALLRWISAQQWGEAWSASLPIGGVDGTLKHRFLATPLAGNIHAKTGTLNATSAISGYLVAASGQRLTFSVFANDIPGGESANVTLDSLLLAVAAAS